MNISKLFVLMSVIATLVTSCKKEVATEAIAKTETKIIAEAKKPAKATLTVEGMTCAIGCAKTIEEDLSKMEGVQKAIVDFDTKIASIDYDAAVLKPDNLVKTVISAADGKTYSVSSVK
jgi:periplasmic mercuric ion binding protein